MDPKLDEAYQRGRHDAIEEIAKMIFPPDGMDPGNEDKWFALWSTPGGRGVADRVRKVMAFVRQHRQSGT